MNHYILEMSPGKYIGVSNGPLGSFLTSDLRQAYSATSQIALQALLDDCKVTAKIIPYPERLMP